jgi:Spy/CpxP family protein refolding chaperone
MKRLILLGAMVLSLAVPMVWAQEQAGGEGGRRGQRGMRGLPDVQQAVTLTAEQKEKVAALREKFAEELGALPRDREAFQKMRDLRQEMSEAAKAGDDAKVEKLRKEINETDMMAQRRKIVSKYYDDVEKVLTAKQKKQFGEYRKLLESDVPAGLVANPDELKAAVKKVELSEAQKKKVDEAFARYEAQPEGIAQRGGPQRSAAGRRRIEPGLPAWHSSRDADTGRAQGGVAPVGLEEIDVRKQPSGGAGGGIPAGRRRLHA